MKQEFKGALPPPSEERIRGFEKYWGIRFPAAFRRLLETNNGAVPTRPSFKQGEQTRTLKRFLPLLDDPKQAGDAGWNDIAVMLTREGERLIEDPDMVGSDVIPIGQLFGEDLLCLSFRNGVMEPTIVVWDHSLSGEDSPHLELVAATFDEFLTMLSSFTE